MTKYLPQACDSVLSEVSSYDHSRVEKWNSDIIVRSSPSGTINNHTYLASQSRTLKSLLAATTPSGTTNPPYKYSITSTIIQHLPPTAAASTTTNGSGEAAAGEKASTGVTGRRGMHSAAGAYWDNANDGMWSYKYEAAAGKGLDVVVAIIWIKV